MGKKLSSKACAKARCCGHRPRALPAAGQWALPTPAGASASCGEALGNGNQAMGALGNVHLSLFIKPGALLLLTFCLMEQHKYLCCISVHLLIFGSLP